MGNKGKVRLSEPPVEAPHEYSRNHPRFSVWKATLLAALIAFLAFGASALLPAQAAALDEEESTFLTLINDYRQSKGLGTLSTNGKLTDTAVWMATDMATNDYFSHTDSLGRDPFDRMADLGYDYNTWKGENLAAGVPDAATALDLWQGSDGHDKNMLNPHFTVIGISRAYDPGATFGWYWATEFGGQGDPPPPPAPTPAPVTPQPTAAPTLATPVPVTPPPPTPAPTPVPATPTPKPTPSPTPVPTPSPEPSPAKPAQLVLLDSPSWWRIALNVKPWWDRLTVDRGFGAIGQDDSVLTSASRMAEKLFDLTGNRFANGNFVHGDDDSGDRATALLGAVD
jgi:uncharacterized protein YkwD